MNPFEKFRHAAALERQLRTMAPGEEASISEDMLLDIEVPADPLDRQTPAFLIEWFRSRMPFHCVTRYDLIKRRWTIGQPRVAA